MENKGRIKWVKSSTHTLIGYSAMCLEKTYISNLYLAKGRSERELIATEQLGGRLPETRRVNAVITRLMVVCFATVLHKATSLHHF